MSAKRKAFENGVFCGKNGGMTGKPSNNLEEVRRLNEFFRGHKPKPLDLEAVKDLPTYKPGSRKPLPAGAKAPKV